MLNINDYHEEKFCVYKDEEYLVRDNGAVLRKSRPNQKIRELDNKWTFGKKNDKNGYLFLASHRVHIIVATAFLGRPPTKEHVVDHIDTNRQNNRPSNLRWTTKFENAVKNPITRKKIEYLTGVDIFEFLANPSEYREDLKNSDYDWMRGVTEEEAKVTLKNLKAWLEKEKIQSHENGKMGEWIFNVRDPEFQKRYYDNFQISDSLTALAKQKDWKTPTKFVCCPIEIDENPIDCYLKKLSIDAIFSTNQYGDSKIVKFASIDNKAIVIITSMPSGVKSFALTKITYENGYYIHSNLGTFFTCEGADKYFTLEQGLKWTGGDSIDDYC